MRLAGVALAAVMACGWTGGADAAPVYLDGDYFSTTYNTSGHIALTYDPSDPSANNVNLLFRQSADGLSYYDGLQLYGYYSYQISDGSPTVNSMIAKTSSGLDDVFVEFSNKYLPHTVNFNGSGYDGNSFTPVTFSSQSTSYIFVLDFSFYNGNFQSVSGSGVFDGDYTLNFIGSIYPQTVTGDVNSLLSPVPLPSSAPMFGAAIAALAGSGFIARRRRLAVGIA